MGWNSWNSFANIVNSQIIQQQARTLAANGMKEAGYEYVVIDEGWWLGERDTAGNIVRINIKAGITRLVPGGHR